MQIGDWHGYVAWWYMSCDASRVHLALLTLTSRWQTSLWILYCNPQISIVERHSIMAPDWLMNCRLACYDSLIVLASFTVSAQLHITSVPRKLWITQGCLLNGERKMTPMMAYFMETLLQKDEVSRRKRFVQPMSIHNKMTFHTFA